ncbi:hypothetical protein [Streptomyces sp. NPDC088757]|uniref:hypothetical protein n=1 Tax=Streptomyces sp. NPDC088757 TaxID=3365889 RepID=UPI003830D8E1
MRRGAWGRRCGAALLAAALAGGTAGCGADAGAGAPPVPGAPGATAGPGSPGATTGTVTPGPSGPTAAPTTPGSPATPDAPRQDPRPGEVLVQVVVTGGFAGVRNRLVVHRNGEWTVSSGDKPSRTGRQAPAEAAGLRAALEDPAFALVPARPTGRPIADGFRYEVTYGHRVVVAGDGDRPPALQRVFDALPGGGPPTSP